MPRINASNDFFIRTSDPRHKERVQAFMQRVHDNGHVYKGLYEGWYCPRCADFKGESEIAEGNTCPIHRIPLDREEEENWFFRLSAFQEQLEELYATNAGWVSPPTRFNEARSFITSGLNDVSLSRAKLTWGVEVPWDPAHVFYVWFDALLNYYTALVVRRGRARSHRRAVARDAADPRQGHPQVPRRDLAGDAARRGRGAPGEAVHPRLPDDEERDGRGPEDVQVARQRAGPVRGDGQVRHRRAPVLLLPRGLLRPGRRGLDRRLRVALRDRAGQRLRQPGEPHDRDDRPLSRRRDARRGARRRARGRLRGPRRRGRRAARPGGDHPGARADLAARPAAQPLRRGAGAVEAREGPGAGRARWTACCARSPRACAW